jgi:Hypothetical protein (DUF2513)
MKRDMDSVRAILINLEEHPHGHAPDEIQVDSYTEEQIGYHLFLMMQAGLIEGEDVTNFEDGSPRAMAKNLTWDGYEFLANAKDESRWDQAKELVKQQGGDVSLGVLTQLLAALARSALGLP